MPPSKPTRRRIADTPPYDEYAWAAPVYDAATLWALTPLRRELAALARRAAPGLQVLDVCCGTGRQCREFNTEGLRAIGVDLSAAMLAKARLQVSPKALLRCDAALLPFASGAFSCATITLALHEKPFHAREAIFLEMLRVTRPGGLVLVADYLAPADWPRQLLSLCVKAVERLAGREHHACYAGWMRDGGLAGFLSRMGVKASEIRPRMSGLAGVAVIRRQ